MKNNSDLLNSCAIICAKVYLGTNLIYEGKFKYGVDSYRGLTHYYIYSLDNNLIADLVNLPSFVFIDEVKYDKMMKEISNAITNLSNLSDILNK